MVYTYSSIPMILTGVHEGYSQKHVHDTHRSIWGYRNIPVTLTELCAGDSQKHTYDTYRNTCRILTAAYP